MIALRFSLHFLTGQPIDRETRRARLVAARRYPVGSVPRRGILSGHWDGGNIVGAYRSSKAASR